MKAKVMLFSINDKMNKVEYGVKIETKLIETYFGMDTMEQADYLIPDFHLILLKEDSSSMMQKELLVVT